MVKIQYKQKKESLFRECRPDIIRITPIEFTDGVVFKPHTHEFPEITFIIDGKSEQIINGKKYSVKKGNIVILNKGDLHEEHSDKEEPLKQCSCMLDNVFLKDLEDNKIIARDVCPIIDCSKYYSEIIDIFKECYYDEISENTYRYEMAKLNIEKIFYYIYREIDKPAQEEEIKSRLADTVKEYIDKHYNEEISLEELSNIFFVSSYHIVHEMKKIFGMSPINYLISRRIGEAQRMLLHSHKTVSEISMIVGYENVNYFNKIFTKKTGIAPGKFREMYVSKGNGNDMNSTLEDLKNLK